MMRTLARRIAGQMPEKGLFLTFFTYNALFYISGAVYGYLSTYYKLSGLSVLQIGLLMACPPLVSLFIQPLWGMAADRSGGHLPVLRMVLAGSMAAVLFYYAGQGFWWLLMMTVLYAGFNSSILPLSDSIVVGQARDHGFNYAMIRMGGTVGYAMVVLPLGFLFRTHLKWMFAMTSAALFAMLLLSLRFPRAGVSRQKRKLEFGKLFRVPGIRFLLFYVFVFQIAQGFYGSFFSVFILEQGHDSSFIGKMMCISACSEIPVLLIINTLLRRFSLRQRLLAAGMCMVVRLFLPMTGATAGFVCAQLLQGVTYMVIYYSTVMFLNEKLDTGLRATGQAVLCMVQSGLAALCSNVLGGMLGDRFGLRTVYLGCALLLFFVTAGCAAVFLFKHYKTGVDERWK